MQKRHIPAAAVTTSSQVLSFFVGASHHCHLADQGSGDVQEVK